MLLVSVCVVPLHRHACDVSEHYKQKLETANKLFWQLQSCQKSLEARERVLNKYETNTAIYSETMGVSVTF